MITAKRTNGHIAAEIHFCGKEAGRAAGLADGVCDWGDCRIELCFVDGVVSGDLIGYLVQQEYFNVEN